MVVEVAEAAEKEAPAKEAGVAEEVATSGRCNFMKTTSPHSAKPVP